MTVVAAPADRRFHRAHVKPARRRALKRAAAIAAKYCVFAVAVVYVLYRCGSSLVRSDLVRVEQVVAYGNSRLSTGELQALLSGLRGENIISTDLEGWRQRLLASPWVKDAALHRSLPSTVEVAITEREPMAIGRINGTLYLIDDHGIVVDDYAPQYADLDLPMVDGLTAPAGSRPTATDETRAGLAGRLIASLKTRPDFLRRLSQIDVADAHNAAVTLSGDPTVMYLGEDHFVSRLTSYLELADAVHERVPEIEYVDLRFDNRVFVRPAAKTPVRRPAAAETRSQKPRHRG